MNIIQELRANKICAIVRGVDASKIDELAQSLIRSGIKVVEVTYNTPGASHMIQELSNNYGNELIVGAGTVLDSETAKSAIDAGAQFVLSPTIDVEVIKICNKYNVLPVPGIMTPTEALKAWEFGAKMVKIFPANVLGPNFIKQLKGPLNQIEVMGVGGITLDNVRDYLEAGASCVGIGSNLVSKDLVDKGDFKAIEDRGRQFLEATK